MKKLLLLLTLICFSLSLYAIDFGYSIAPVGEKSPSGDSFGAMSISFLVSPLGESRVGTVEVEALLAATDDIFEGVNLKISSPIFSSLENPFGFLFANATLWSPKASVGTQYRVGEGWDIYMGIAPFNFQDTDFVYEFLSPYATYNVSTGSWGYGAYVMRFISFY